MKYYNLARLIPVQLYICMHYIHVRKSKVSHVLWCSQMLSMPHQNLRLPLVFVSSKVGACRAPRASGHSCGSKTFEPSKAMVYPPGGRNTQHAQSRPYTLRETQCTPWKNRFLAHDILQKEFVFSNCSRKRLTLWSFQTFWQLKDTLTRCRKILKYPAMLCP